MTTRLDLGSACSRAWQAEAALDGRLSRADAESFQRHVATCEHCTREVRSLDTLRAVGERLTVLTSTPLEQRRLRQSVLRAANELALHPRRAPRKHAIAFGAFALAAAAAVLALLVLWPPSAPDSSAPVVVGVPTYQIQTSQDAVWSSRNHATTARLLLQGGWFELSVDKLRASQRFLLELPDGELEVKGTRFIVEVRDAKTARVRVHEGRVALRLRGQPPLLLGTGDSWPPLAAAPAATTKPIAPLAGAASNESAESSRVRAPVPSAAPTPPARGTGSVIEAPTDSIPPAGDAFAQAMSAFSAGDFGKAERLFTAFERAHPADARVEDATFLRAVARARRGDVTAAQAIARDYLRRYPNGLRRAEAERLLR